LPVDREAGDMVDAALVAILVLLVGFVFFVYLMIRRTFTQVQQGIEGGKDGP
jgi:preprotein translocase subunit YajC